MQNDRSPSQLHGIGNSGIEITPENETQRAEGQVIEMGDSPRLESDTIANGRKWTGEEESIIRPNRSAQSGSLGKEADLRGEYSFANIAKPSL